MRSKNPNVPEREEAIDALSRLGVFTTDQAQKAGVSKPTLSRLLKAKLITRLEHGLYIKSEADFPDDIEFVIACHKFGPEALIGGLSALLYHAITEQVPAQTWVMVPNSKRGNYSDKYLAQE